MQGQVFLEAAAYAALGEVPGCAGRRGPLTILRVCHHVHSQVSRVVTAQACRHIVGGSGRVLPTLQVGKIIIASPGRDVMKVITIGATAGDLIEQWIDEPNVEATLLQ